MYFTKEHLFSYTVWAALTLSLFPHDLHAQSSRSGTSSPRDLKSPRLSSKARKDSSLGLKRSSHASSPRKTYFTIEPNSRRLREVFQRELDQHVRKRTQGELFRDETPAVEVTRAILENTEEIIAFKARLVKKAVEEIERDQSDQEPDLIVIAAAVLHEFFNPKYPAPPQLAVLLGALDDSLQTKLPDQKYPLLGAILLLRFVCPALANPDALRVKASDTTRQALVLVATLLQAIANQVEPAQDHKLFRYRGQMFSLQGTMMHALDLILKQRLALAEPVELVDVAIGTTTLKELLSPLEIVAESDVVNSSPYGTRASCSEGSGHF